MSKIYNLYENKLDRTWYNSSNIKYSECDDIDDSLKTVRVIFGDGRTYQYENVNVHDYLLFREDLSQGKALNKYLKQYSSTRLVNSDVKIIEENMTKLIDNIDYSIINDGESIAIMDKNNNVSFKETIEDINKDAITNIIKAISSLNLKIKYNAN